MLVGRIVVSLSPVKARCLRIKVVVVFVSASWFRSGSEAEAFVVFFSASWLYQ